MHAATVFTRFWKILCSLKLAIYLASAATLLIMGGSLLMIAHPQVFGPMDRAVLGDWFAALGRHRSDLTWWLPAAGVLLVLLGINTLCCFIGWLRRLGSRWRKTGEYLIHLGFILILFAYLWGTQAGFRSEGNRLWVGETLSLPQMPGYALHLEAFEPVAGPGGRPIDMRSTVALLRHGETIRRQEVRTNTPLTYRGLVVVPGSFGQMAEGFRFFLSGHGSVELTPGTTLPLEGGGVLRVIEFYPHAGRGSDGRAVWRGDTLGSPAIELEIVRSGVDPWRGWYFLRERLPFPLVEAGVRLWPTEPLFRQFSVLTVNRDPGAGIALVGGVLMLAGVLVALISFYYKRARGDRPEIV